MGESIGGMDVAVPRAMAPTHPVESRVIVVFRDGFYEMFGLIPLVEQLVTAGRRHHRRRGCALGCRIGINHRLLDSILLEKSRGDFVLKLGLLDSVSRQLDRLVQRGFPMRVVLLGFVS